MNKDDALRVQQAFRSIFNTPQGTVVLEHLFKNLRMHETTFVQGDPYTSAYNEGRRSVVIEILRHCEQDFTPFFSEALNNNYRR